MEQTGLDQKVVWRMFHVEQSRKPCTSTITVMGPPQPEHASLVTKARRLRTELTVWGRNGFKMAPREVRRARLATCALCKYWNAKGNWGLGECQYPGCGCSRAKAALATSRCPAGKWPA